MALLCGIAAPALAEQEHVLPPFSVGIELPSQIPVAPTVESALHDIGFDFLNYYVKPVNSVTDEHAARINDALLDLVERLDVDFAIATYAEDPPDACVTEALSRGATEQGASRFKGVIFDEVEHCRLMNLHSPVPLADPNLFTTFDEAYQGTLEGYRALKARFEALGSPVIATHIWPVLLHPAARAGVTLCPKICKELYSSVSLAIAMGAALQYGTDLWANCDLWFWDAIPGHPADEFKSNLLLAYWLGVDRVYVEGCGFNLRDPSQLGPPFVLMNQITNEDYQLTEHGEVLRWFCREYLPKHPRSWTFRDVKPNVAIVRFPDGCHGQRFTWLPKEWADNLYGSPHLKSTPDTEAWFQIWNVLTHGKTGRDGLTFFKATVSASGHERPVNKHVAQSLHSRPVMTDSHRFFVPLRGVVVFDHLVEYERLKDIPLIFVTGVQLSEGTLSAIRQRASEGATVIFWGPLAERLGIAHLQDGVQRIAEGNGTILVTDDFGRRDLLPHMLPNLGQSDEIRYRFGEQEVILRRVTDNSVRVEFNED